MIAWLFIMLAAWVGQSGDVDAAAVLAQLAIAAAILRLRPGWLSREWRKNLDEQQQQSLYRGE